MLVLSRKKDQQIAIDGDINIVVLKITGSTVQLGISAPSHFKVLRGELKPFGMESCSKVIECEAPPANVGIQPLADNPKLVSAESRRLA